MNPFYLVKVTDEKWARRFLDGEVYMSPLSSFGDLLRRNDVSNNDFRGDLLEGTSHSFDDKNESSFFREALSDEPLRPHNLGQIAECYLQEKIFCLFCLEFSKEDSKFIRPDRRMIHFGDTAVIILEPMIFLKEIFDVFLSLYGNKFWAGARRVTYSINLEKPSNYDEFSKRNLYSWQNEYRIALDSSQGFADQRAWDDMTDMCRIMFLNQGGRVNHSAKREPSLFNIGDIRYLCSTVPTNDLINLRIPVDVMRNPTNLRPIEPPRMPVVTSYRPILKW